MAVGSCAGAASAWVANRTTNITMESPARMAQPCATNAALLTNRRSVCKQNRIGERQKVMADDAVETAPLVRPKRRVIKAPAVRRAELLDCAQRLFMQKGYEKTTINDMND